jgi:hypothetical protein
VENIYFSLTEAFNRHLRNVALASGQAVVFYRIAIMSKDGDWIIRESPDACEQVLSELDARRARYRLGAPLDVRWLAGGWSSHFEFFDDAHRRVRCDFVSRPPRVPRSSLEALFDPGRQMSTLVAVEPESLILMKQTQRAKDYPVIAELARLLPPDREIEFSTDPDRILELAHAVGAASRRRAVQAAASGGGRLAVVLALAAEVDELQQQDAARLSKYTAAAEHYFEECRRVSVTDLPLRRAHFRMCEIAEQYLPTHVGAAHDADAQ